MKTLFVVAVLVACAAAQPYSGGKFESACAVTVKCAFRAFFLFVLLAAPLEAEFSPTRVPGEYVVVFQENITDNDGKLQFVPNYLYSP